MARNSAHNLIVLANLFRGVNFRKAPKAPRLPKMALTSEETEKLASLHGKVKRLYVKELKAKYGV